MPEILFLTSANLTTNPRLQKELKLAVSINYNVHFIGFDLDNWSQKIDAELIKNINASFHYIPVTKKAGLKWLTGSLIEKIAQKVYPFFKKNLKINAFAHSKRSFLLCQYLKHNKNKYDLIVAHTLPALYPAMMLAKKTKTPFIFDIEDYHPGELITKGAEKEKQRRTFLMQKILPKADFITYASPLIGKYSLDLIKNYPEEKHQLINNCFSENEFEFAENNPEKVKFVWFSQNIAAGRGLELVLPALAKFTVKIELHLIGNLYQNFYDDFLSKYDFINIHRPLPQKELNLSLKNYDIGLAIELSTADFNRQICLTNKIWAYVQSGLYILASDTPAQKKFISENKNIGAISEQNIESFEKATAKIIENIAEIRKNKKQRFEYARKFTWGKESEKLKEIWIYILNHIEH